MAACSTNCAAKRSEREIRQAIEQARYEGKLKKRRAAYRKTAPYGGPAASRRVMPRWGDGATWRVPPLPKIGLAYAAAKVTSAGKALGPDDLLICRTSCRGDCVWDRSVSLLSLGLAEEADLRVSLYLGERELAVGADSSNGEPAYVHLPAAGLHAGQRLRLRVFDVDGLALERMGEVEVALPPKLPLRYRAKSFEGRCYALPPAWVEKQVVDLFIEAEDLLNKQRRSPLRPPRGSFDWARVHAARRAVGKIAALVGWADPRMVELLTRVRASWRRLVAYNVGDGSKPRPVAKQLRALGARLRVVCGEEAAKLRDRLQPPKRRGGPSARLFADARCLAWVVLAKAPERPIRLRDTTLLTSRGFAIDMRNVLRLGRESTPMGFELLYAPLQGAALPRVAVGQPRLLVFPGVEVNAPPHVDVYTGRMTTAWLPVGKKKSR